MYCLTLRIAIKNYVPVKCSSVPSNCPPKSLMLPSSVYVRWHPFLHTPASTSCLYYMFTRSLVHQTLFGEPLHAKQCARHPKPKLGSENWSKLPRVTQLMRSRSGWKTSESMSLYFCASQKDLFFPWGYWTSFFSSQSTSDFSFSVIVENVNCYNSGIICRKFISINVGNSLIIFGDDSGNPVRPGAGEGRIDNLQVNRAWGRRGLRTGFLTTAVSLRTMESAAQTEFLGQSQEHRGQC